MARSNQARFVLELPLRVTEPQAVRVRAHLEAARCLYNALLGEAPRRLERMRRDPGWQQARALPRGKKRERQQAFAALRERHDFSEYGMHAFAKRARCTWLAEHVDSTMAQTLASRAYQAANRVCLGKARRVRFKSQGRGLDSVEGKRNDTGMRFVLPSADGRSPGGLRWQGDLLEALIAWDDPVVVHGLRQPIAYARLVRRQASSPRAQGADATGARYAVQLVLWGTPYQKPKHAPGTDVLGLDLGPSSLAFVSRGGAAGLLVLAEEVQVDTQRTRRLQRHLERQRRANNPDHYDAQGRIKPRGQRPRHWRESQGYRRTRQQLATQARRQAAQRTSAHGQLVHDLLRLGTHITIEKHSYRGWQKQYGRSVGTRAPGMLIERLRRLVARTGGILREVSTFPTKCSQYCHGCGTYHPKALSERWHQCPCGIGPVQRDLYSATLLCYLDANAHVPSLTQADWAGVETRLRAVMEVHFQRAKEGQTMPRSFGIPRAGVCPPKSPGSIQQEPPSSVATGQGGSAGVGPGTTGVSTR